MSHKHPCSIPLPFPAVFRVAKMRKSWDETWENDDRRTGSAQLLSAVWCFQWTKTQDDPRLYPDPCGIYRVTQTVAGLLCYSLHFYVNALQDHLCRCFLHWHCRAGLCPGVRVTGARPRVSLAAARGGSPGDSFPGPSRSSAWYASPPRLHILIRARVTLTMGLRVRVRGARFEA